MRERLVGLLVGMTVLIIALLAVPRAYFLAQLVETDERESLDRAAALVSVVLDERASAGRPLSPEFLSSLITSVEGIRVVTEQGTLAAGLDVAGSEVLTATRTWRAGAASVTLARSRAFVDQQISQAIVPLVVAGLILVMLSTLLAFWFSARLARPFQALAAAATRLGSGRFTEVTIDHYAVPEAENIGDALRVSGQRLDALLQREREFAANASHQLRTPITALRLQLEDLTYWPETAPEVADELRASMGELDRLSAAVTQYLDLARGKRRALEEQVELRALARAAVERRRDGVEAEGRTIDCSPGPEVLVVTQPGTVDQILDVLLDNAVQHGAGAITVSVDRSQGLPVLRVADEGRRSLDPAIFQRGHSSGGGTGLGLAVATQLCHTLGARLDLCDTEHTCFELQLPDDATDALTA